MLLPKPRRIVDARYRRFVKSFACCVCGRRTVDAAHIGSKGLGSKASDYTCIPLCREHHELQHQLGSEELFADQYGLDIEEVQRDLLDRYAAERRRLR